MSQPAEQRNQPRKAVFRCLCASGTKSTDADGVNFPDIAGHSR